MSAVPVEVLEAPADAVGGAGSTCRCFGRRWMPRLKAVVPSGVAGGAECLGLKADGEEGRDRKKKNKKRRMTTRVRVRIYSFDIM